MSNEKHISLLNWNGALSIISIVLRSHVNQIRGKKLQMTLHSALNMMEDTFRPLCARMDAIMEAVENNRVVFVCPKCRNDIDPNGDLKCSYCAQRSAVDQEMDNELDYIQSKLKYLESRST